MGLVVDLPRKLGATITTWGELMLHRRKFEHAKWELTGGEGPVFTRETKRKDASRGVLFLMRHRGKPPPGILYRRSPWSANLDRARRRDRKRART